MRSIISISATILAACIAAGSAQAQQQQCDITGFPVTFGVNGSGYFDLKSGQTCQYGFAIAGGGAVSGSRIAVRPRHGTATMQSVTSFQYSARPGYRGPDTFVIEVNGSGMFGSGKSLLTMNVVLN